MIKLTNGKLYLNDVVVEDRDVVSYFGSIKTDGDMEIEARYQNDLVRALKIGVLAIQRSQTQVDIDAIRSEFDKLHDQMERALDEVFNKERGDLVTSLVAYLGEDGKMVQLLDDMITGDSSEFSRKLDYTEQNSPLRKLHEDLQKKFKDLDDRIIDVQNLITGEQSKEEEAEKGARKGVEFEAILESILDDLAQPHKDLVTPVGNQEGVGGSKKGDFLIEINKQDTDGKKAVIVVEAKRKHMGGKKGILNEIDEAKSNRNADFAIAVFSEDACPPNVAPLCEFSDNRLICCIPADGTDHLALDLAYSVARTEVVWQMRHASGGFDKERITEAFKWIRAKLKDFIGIKQSATSLIKTANQVRSDLDKLEEDIKNHVNQILQNLDDEFEPEMPESEE